LGLARGSLESIAALYGYAAAYWTEGGTPSVLIKVPHRMNKLEADGLREDFLGTHKGGRVPAVLWGGAEIEPFASSPADAQLADAHGNAIAEVARLYRVPPSLVNAAAGDSLTYSTTVEQLRSWLVVGLQPYLARIEAAFSDLLPYGTTARFDTAELLRSDWAARL